MEIRFNLVSRLAACHPHFISERFSIAKTAGANLTQILLKLMEMFICTKIKFIFEGELANWGWFQNNLVYIYFNPKHMFGLNLAGIKLVVWTLQLKFRKICIFYIKHVKGKTLSWRPNFIKKLFSGFQTLIFRAYRCRPQIGYIIGVNLVEIGSVV